MAKRDRQVGLADARGSEEDHVLAPLDEAELVQTLDLLALDRGLEGKVELLDRFDRRQSRGAHRGLHRSISSSQCLHRQRSLGERLKSFLRAGASRPTFTKLRHIKSSAPLNVSHPPGLTRKTPDVLEAEVHSEQLDPEVMIVFSHP